MRQKITVKIRPEFRRLLVDKRTLKAAAELLGTTWQNVSTMKGRGYCSVETARHAERVSEGAYKARLLAKRGEIK